MLDHQGRKGYGYDETVEVFGELTRLAQIIDATSFVASAALLYYEDAGWAWNHVAAGMGRVLDMRDISTQARLLRWYTPLYKHKVSVDVLHPLRDLSPYRVVFAPNLYLVNREIADNLSRYVRRGGLLIVGPKAALKDWSNVFYEDIPPCAGLSEILGVTTRLTRPLWFGGLPTTRVTLVQDAPFAGGMSFANEGLYDALEPAQARTLALHANGDAAITRNEYGDGSAIYMGCEPEETFYHQLITWLIGIGKLDPVLRTEADVEITMRAGGGYRLIFVLNHNAEPAEIVLEKEYRELLADKPVSGVLVVKSGEVKILSEETR